MSAFEESRAYKIVAEDAAGGTLSHAYLLGSAPMRATCAHFSKSLQSSSSAQTRARRG